MKATFEIICGLTNGIGPIIDVYTNNQIKLNDRQLTNNNLISVEFDNDQDTSVIIQHKNKVNADTVVVDGKITQDKYLEVKNIWIDDILLPDAFVFTVAKPNYFKSYLDSLTEAPSAEYKSNSLYFNGTLEYIFQKDFFHFLDRYIQVSDEQSIKNTSDPEYNSKYLGYDQDTEIENQIVNLLAKHEYHITR